MLKLTTEEFIFKARQVHGDKYDYSNVDYINNKTKVIIICPIHGKFELKAVDHYGRGCPKCKAISIGDKLRSSSEEFITKARRAHGDKYDYSKVKYTVAKSKVIIICPTHGEFEQVASNHLDGSGCYQCYQSLGANKKLSTDEFITRARQVHGDKYDYSKVKYTTAKSKVIIICPIHGEFEQFVSDHLRERGCARCGTMIISKPQQEIYNFVVSCFN